MKPNGALTVAVYQMNAIVGDLLGNTDKLLKQIAQAKAKGAEVFIAPELALCGYPAEDLLLRADFYLKCNQQLERLLRVDGITLVIGCPYRIGMDNFNSALVIQNGSIVGRYDKMVLPNYGVFDECRYFTPGVTPLTFEVNGVKCGVIICEDMWETTPILETQEAGAELVFILNASPYEVEKQHERLRTARYRAAEAQLSLIYVNQVGGQDELVFDGASFALDQSGQLLYQGLAFQEQLSFLEYSAKQLQSMQIAPYPDLLASLYAALVLAVKDYVTKNGFKGIVLGLSGGIDSALTLAIAVDALGSDQVMALMLPSQYTADISILDAAAMAKGLQVKYHEIAIKTLFDQFQVALAPLFSGTNVDTTEENLQARIRGNLIMAVSNKFGYLVLTTGNKSELTTGYATLYGDMAGGFAVLKDVTKTQVYALAKWRNEQGQVIPWRVITRPPSAELKENQCDQDSLPDYASLDAILVNLVEHRLSTTAIIELGYAAAEVIKVANLLKQNEYKRRQAAIGPKISRAAFGRDWRYPNTNKFKF